MEGISVPVDTSRFEPYLARVLTAGMSPDQNVIIKQKKSGELAQGNRSNPIMQGQAAVWFSVEPHQRLLLASDAPVPIAFEAALR